MNKITFAVSGLIWDLDGTLMDSVQLKEVVLNGVLNRRGLPTPTHQQYLNTSGGRMLETIQNLTGLTGSLLQDVYDEFIGSEEHYYEQPESLFFTDALLLMRRARRAGLTQILISNRPHYNDARLGSPRNLANRLPLAGYMDAVVCGDDHDYYKPDPRVLERVEAGLGLVRSELLVVGDQHVDIALACNLGAQAVVVSRNGETLDHLDELPAGWESTVQIVTSFKDVVLEKSTSRLDAALLATAPLVA